MARSRQQKRSKLQEQRVAKDIGGQVQAGSGSSWRAKSDVRSVLKNRVECKYTEYHVYTLKLDDILKIQEEALLGGLEAWAIQVEFVQSIGQSFKVAVLPFALFRDLWLKVNKDQDFCQTCIGTTSKSVRLKLDEIRSGVGTAAQYGGTWVEEITFYPATGSPIVIGVVNWDTYTDLLEKISESPKCAT